MMQSAMRTSMPKVQVEQVKESEPEAPPKISAGRKFLGFLKKLGGSLFSGVANGIVGNVVGNVTGMIDKKIDEKIFNPISAYVDNQFKQEVVAGEADSK